MSNVGFDPLSPWLRFRPPLEDLPGFRVRPVDVAPDGVPGLAGWQPPATATAQPAPDNAPPAAEAASYPWWERSTGPNTVFEGGSEPHWPWLRAPTDEVPGFRLNPDGSVRTDEPGAKVRLMAGAFAPLEPQEQPNDVAGSNGVTSSDVVPPPPAGAPLSTISAASIAVPASAGAAVDLAGLMARAAPAVAGAGSAAAGALPFLFIPTNTQSETTDLGDGLRARVRPGSGPWRSSDVSTTAYSAPASARNGRPCQSKPSRSWAGTAAPTLSSITSNSIERLDGARRWNRRPPVPARWRNRRKTGSRSNRRRLVSAPTADEANKPGIGNPPAAQSLAPSQDRRQGP